MTAEQDETPPLQLPLTWMVDPSMTPAVVNQVMFRPGVNASNGTASGFYMTLGHVTPPMFPQGFRQEDVNSVSAVPVSVVGHYYIPLGFAEDLHRALTNALSAAQE